MVGTKTRTAPPERKDGAPLMCSEKTKNEGTGPRLWTIRNSPFQQRGQAQYVNVDIVTVCSAPRALLFWKGWLYVVPLPPHSVLSCEKGWVLVLGVIKLYSFANGQLYRTGPRLGECTKHRKGIHLAHQKATPCISHFVP